jgi:pyruvate formate lyase activating enzyme
MPLEKIAGFIASLDETIPYSLLVFHPDFMMQDLPITPAEQAFEAYRTAKKHLKNVELGNIHLLYRQQSGDDGLGLHENHPLGVRGGS